MKRINTMNQFLDHLADDVMPALLDRLASESKTAEKEHADANPSITS
jgi:hypothetical protein